MGPPSTKERVENLDDVESSINAKKKDTEKKN